MVMEMLEANYWEQMVVELLFQEDYALDAEFSDLECKPGEHLLDRRILLRGRMSYLARIYAESFIVWDRLPEFIRDGLVNSAKPIGLPILENRLETFREILGCVREEAGQLARLCLGARNALYGAARTQSVGHLLAFGMPFRDVTADISTGSEIQSAMVGTTVARSTMFRYLKRMTYPHAWHRFVSGESNYRVVRRVLPAALGLGRNRILKEPVFRSRTDFLDCEDRAIAISVSGLDEQLPPAGAHP